PDGTTLAFVRGTGDLRHGARLEEGTEFELVIVEDGARERVVTEVSGTPNFASRMPLTVAFGPDGRHLYFTEFENDTLALRRVRRDGADETTLYRFPHAVRAVPSPDLGWIAFREYHRSWITPFEYIGRTITVSAHDDQGTTFRVDEARDGVYTAWSEDGRTLSWSRAGKLFEKSVAAILNGGPADSTDLAFEF
ncbi:MAG: hypothetical protein GWN85_20620, partial [Gemmatimonadetes bacterium]|nr:hypothetical protein [Gemmatimonadota bacterium]NIS35153.1 hypothetical protein [Actinomycetota bacterium]NIU69880.1 hypothetical protein [Actinomycetota bacterium]NIW31756.1 hypothetical protein [Actinomycetota bacterium]NIX21912.1 hypothetical protein [Actinomycetota bacterium]